MNHEPDSQKRMLLVNSKGVIIPIRLRVPFHQATLQLIPYIPDGSGRCIQSTFGLEAALPQFIPHCYTNICAESFQPD